MQHNIKEESPVTCRDCNTPISPGEQWGSHPEDARCATCAEGLDRDALYRAFVDWIEREDTKDASQ